MGRHFFLCVALAPCKEFACKYFGFIIELNIRGGKMFANGGEQELIGYALGVVVFVIVFFGALWNVEKDIRK